VAVSEDFERCIAGGGVALFPSDTVYGLACDPGNAAAIERMYALKGRDLAKPSALMVFSVDALPPLPPRVAAAARVLLPGPVTIVCGPIGVRVPDVPLLADVAVPVLQTSANAAGGPDPRTLAEVPRAIRDGADLVVDGGELPGTPSTVVDLTHYDDDGRWTILREGAVPRAAIAAALA
jgi:L-threonylcarbamoyladenylate synthase